MTLTSRDAAVIWHPYTQHKTSVSPIPIVKGKGAYLYDENGKPYLDLISSWWVTLHGHAHPVIAKAIYDQALQLEHAIFAGFTHEPAIEVAEILLKMLPDNFSKVFYSDNGSTAVEVALKMSYQYWRNLGENKRTRFIAFEGAYHGDTVGAMSVGRCPNFFTEYEGLLFSIDQFPYPLTWMNDENVLEKEERVLAQLSAHLDQYGATICALIIEPLIQGCSGMRMCTPRFMQALEKLVRAHGILIIYDEVMTGFARTGSDFACIKSETAPDIICLAKALTGGYLPVSVTVCSEKIYQAFLGDTVSQTLIHGHSFTANPMGCAAALASLKLLQQPEVQQQIALFEQIHREELPRMMAAGIVENARYCGTIAAFNLKIPAGYGSQQSKVIQNNFHSRGLIVRPLGNVFYFIPPLCVTETELRGAYAIAMEEMQGVTA